jgi:hypothetical protein
LHQLRFGHLTIDEPEILPVDARLYRRRWYNGFVAHIGEGFIAVGRSLKERNSGININLPFQSYGD